MKKHLFWIFYLIIIGWIAKGVKLEKSLLYDKHTLEDKYMYGKIKRKFQWGKISHKIDSLVLFENETKEFGALDNYRNRNGWAPIADSAQQDENYREIQDKYGIRRNQAIPLYRRDKLSKPERYERDGTLVSILKDSADYLLIRPATFQGEWFVPARYVERLGGADFRHLIFVDRTNQNIATLEQRDSLWLIRSMNPITSGARCPPYRWETPAGIYVIRGKLEKMFYLQDGRNEIAGYAPWASRFSGGGYLHGITVAYPNKTEYEFSWSLGTIPRSHMCVRNATSHAKFIYDWAPVGKTLVVIFD